MKNRIRLVDCATSFLVLSIAAASSAQWAIQNSNTTADLRGIHSVDGKVAWASGTNGTVLRTVDGGEHWQTCTVPPGAEKLDFRGVQAFDAKTAIVMSSGKGDLSRLYKTTDGCKTWKLVFTNPDKDGFWDALYFENKRTGWLLGDPVKDGFVLYATYDGGNAWIRQHNKGLHADPSMQGAFAASNSSLTAWGGFVGFASGGKDGAFVYTVVQSETCVDCSESDLDLEGRRNKWDRQPVLVGSSSESSGIFSIAELVREPPLSGPDNVMIAVGGDYKEPENSKATAAFTKDHGRTWTSAVTMPHGYRSAVAWDAAAKMWITVGPNGTDVSTDDGKNWSALRPDAARGEAADADRNWNALSLTFVVGPKGRIGKRTEGSGSRGQGSGKQ
jgi:photosystem II stability/assembly factor-like uncharacterized protein